MNAKISIFVAPLVSLFAMSAALSASSASARGEANSYFVDSKVPPEVRTANEAFLRGDFAELGVDIKRALLAYPGDATVQTNMLDLFDKSYELRGDRAIASDWNVPKEITYLALSSKRRLRSSRNEVVYRINMYGDLKSGQEMEQVQVIRYPGETILDKQAGVGDFEPGTSEGHPNFFFSQNYHSQPNSEGLYLLTLKVRGQEAVQGWFVLSHMNSTETPALAVPKADQVFTTPTPSFAWSAFTSPQYRSFERRGLYVSVTERKDWIKSNIWELDGSSTLPTAATVGAGQTGENGAKALPPGEYIFQVSYREGLHLGDLMIRRESATDAPFTVR